MTTFNHRTTEEQELIRKAYDFEIAAIHAESMERNPYRDRLKEMGVWEEIEIAVEMAFHGSEWEATK